MSFVTHLDHAQKLVIFTVCDVISSSDLTQAIAILSDPEIPFDYDVITVMKPEAGTTVTPQFLVQHAMNRAKTLEQRSPPSMIRSALVGPTEQLNPLVELWPSFFPTSEGKLSVRLFETLEEALNWLEREPYDTATLPSFAIAH